MIKYSQFKLKYFVLSIHYHFITLKYNCFNTLKCYPCKPIRVQGFTALKRYPSKPIGVQGFNALKYEIPTKPIGIVGEARVLPINDFSKISFTLLVKFLTLSNVHI